MKSGLSPEALFVIRARSTDACNSLSRAQLLPNQQEIGILERSFWTVCCIDFITAAPARDAWGSRNPGRARGAETETSITCRGFRLSMQDYERQGAFSNLSIGYLLITLKLLDARFPNRLFLRCVEAHPTYGGFQRRPTYEVDYSHFRPNSRPCRGRRRQLRFRALCSRLQHPQQRPRRGRAHAVLQPFQLKLPPDPLSFADAGAPS
jgi:hypothetical protein